ncbi:MAG: hypothetical protein L6264_04285 [Weeksellaceae bacterium]|nr:hypothetical protein [Bacteroidota bacterium]MCG2780144.1 hypothetical protein [Weeksellaceae bacterium]
MINFEISNSPFFLENKTYVEDILAQIEDYNPRYSGFCNAYGYDIEIKLIRSVYLTTLKLHKHQSTQAGSLKPINSVNFYKTEIELSKIYKNDTIKIGKSKLQRIFTGSLNKPLLPSPFYIKTSKERIPEEVIDFIKQYQVENFLLENQKLKVILPTKVKELAILGTLEGIIKNCL